MNFLRVEVSFAILNYKKVLQTSLAESLEALVIDLWIVEDLEYEKTA